MDLLPLTQTPSPSHSETLFRETRLGKAVTLLILLSILAGMLYAWLYKDMPTWVLLVIGGFLFLFTAAVANMLRKTFGPENWTLRLEGRTLYVKFRSYQNEHFADDEPAVLALRDQDVEYASPAVEKTITRPDSENLRVERVKCLDLRLRDGLDLRPLESALAAERAHRPVGNSFSRSKSHHTPAWLVDGRTLRIAWRGNGTCLTPSLPKALEALSAVIRVDSETRHETHDYTTPQSPDAAPEKIRELAQRGRILDATQLARKATGASLSEARKQVDQATE